MNVSVKTWLTLGVAIVGLSAGGSPGFAQDSSTAQQQRDEQLQSQIRQLQDQIRELQNEVHQKPAPAPAPVAAQAPAPPPNAPKVVETATHRFGLESADGQNSIFLTGRIHFDVGDYFDYDRKNANAPRNLDAGENFRRARIGVTGKFMGDFAYSLVYDFGGSSDALTNSSVSSNTVTSGIENAFITYNGFYSHHQFFPVAIDIGAMDVPWTLDEATSSNDIMFLERSSAQVIATSYGGGDSRTAIGVRSNNDRYWLGAYVTGPTTGALHTSSANTAACAVGTLAESQDYCDGPQLSFLARGSYQVVQNNESSLHLGVNFADLFRPRTTGNLAEISLSDRPELRIDPTTFLGTGSIAANGGLVFGAEAAAAWENLYIQGEYFHYTIDQLAGGFPTLDFDGGYAEASYSFGGRRSYNPATGAYTAVLPAHPLSFETGGWGALEVAARYSTVDLNGGNSSLACPASSAVAVLRVCGGSQEVWTFGLNYYPNYNVRFMLDYSHASVSAPAGSATAKAADFDAIAARTQISF